MTTATRGAEVRLTGLGISYERGEDILEGIDLTVRHGEFVAFVGPSGGGKTTLLRLVAGLLAPTRGTVTINDRSPAEARAGTAVVFQDPTLLPWRTAAANVALGPELSGASARDRLRIAAERLALVGLADAADKYPHELSGGMRMRVSVARALAGSPRLLLMDEPFGALDELTRQRLDAELLRLRDANGWTALFVTHSAAEAVFLADRVVVLGGRPGQIVGEVAVALNAPRDDSTRESEAYFEAVREVSRLLRQRGKDDGR